MKMCTIYAHEYVTLQIRNIVSKPMRPKAREMTYHGGHLAGWRESPKQVRFL
jgi:hypothetical protein